MLKVMDPMVLSKESKSFSDDDDDGVAIIHESWKKGPVHYLNRGHDG
jgi:hypothetical protein